MVEDLGLCRVELGHHAAPRVVVHADREAVAARARPRATRDGGARPRCRARRGTARARCPGVRPAAAIASRDAVDARREPVVRRRASRRSRAGSRRRAGTRRTATSPARARFVAQVAPRSPVEVVVPGAPADQERRTDPRARFAARRCAAQVSSSSAGSSPSSRTIVVQRAATHPRASTAPPSHASVIDLDPAVDDRDADRAGVAIATEEADAQQMRPRSEREHRHLFRAQLARRGHAGIGVERGAVPAATARSVRRVVVDAEPQGARRRPRLVPLHEQARRSRRPVPPSHTSPTASSAAPAGSVRARANAPQSSPSSTPTSTGPTAYVPAPGTGTSTGGAPAGRTRTRRFRAKSEPSCGHRAAPDPPAGAGQLCPVGHDDVVRRPGNMAFALPVVRGRGEDDG